MRRLLKSIVVILITIFYRVEVIGKEKIPDKGGAVLCTNHIGELDMLFIGYKINRWINFMAKEELFRIPILGRFIRFLGAYPVRRGKSDVEAIKASLKLLKAGNIIGIFPEGTRTKGKDISSIVVKPGATMLAIKAKVPIIPVAISGSQKIFSKIKVVFGDPIYFEVTEDKNYSRENQTQIMKEIMINIYSMLEEK